MSRSTIDPPIQRGVKSIEIYPKEGASITIVSVKKVDRKLITIDFNCRGESLSHTFTKDTVRGWFKDIRLFHSIETSDGLPAAIDNFKNDISLTGSVHEGEIYDVEVGHLSAAGPLPLPERQVTKGPELSQDMLPEVLRAYANDVCERGNFPFDYVAITLMTALGSVIGRQCAVYPKLKDDWHEYPNLWSLCVGTPGKSKSPSISSALAPLDELKRNARAEYEQNVQDFTEDKAAAEIRIKAEKKIAKKSADEGHPFELCEEMPEEPIERRYTTSDVTTAALTELLKQNPNGILLEADEVVSIFKAFDRDTELRPFLLSSWSGKQGYTSDRIGRGLGNHVPSCCLSWVGSTQPGKLIPLIRGAQSGGQGDDGFLQRFQLIAYVTEQKPWKHVDREPDWQAQQAAIKLFRRLDNLRPPSARPQSSTRDEEDTQCEEKGMNIACPDGLRFSKKANAVFVEWWEALESRIRSGEAPEMVEAALQKQRKLVPSIALICQLAADPEAREIALVHVQTAIKWAKWSEANQQRLMLEASSDDIGAAKRILKKIVEGKLDGSFTARDVYRPCWKGLSEKNTVCEALDLLVVHRWLDVREIASNGRKSQVYSLANGVTLEKLNEACAI